jgi:activator of HSP90 ATPase
MRASPITRRQLTAALTLLPAGLGAAARSLTATGHPQDAAPGKSDGLSHSAESIHQEVTFTASCPRVYEALTVAAQFDAITRLSDAVTLVTAPGAQATAISSEVGGAFTLFGGYITGRHLEMLPGERLVQAWRAGSWKAGEYSVVRFSLAARGTDCRLIFDHGGFPAAQGASLAYGWRVHYWEPMAKFLRPA